MNNSIETLRQLRMAFLKLIEPLTTEELNKIPPGFNNNLVWNLGHLIATQQSISYLRNNLTPFVNENYFTLYKPGTKPEKPVSAETITEMKTLFLDAIDHFEKDVETGVFSTPVQWITGYGNKINTINDTIEFVLFHEGLHRGYVMALKRVLTTTA